jgi:stearoyl-CoA desaturase (delta-9 desaturase)
VWDLKSPPERVLRNEQRLGARVIGRAAEQLVARFDSERIALAVTSSLSGPGLAALREKLFRGQDRTAELLTALRLPNIPSREKFLIEARALFVPSASIDEIVDRARERVLASVSMRLTATLHASAACRIHRPP